MNYARYLRYLAIAAAGALLIGTGQAAPAPTEPQRVELYTVCTDAPWSPFQVGHDGGMFGFDIDVMRAIAAVQGFDVQIQDMVFDSIIPSLRHGECDIGASSFSVNHDRRRLIDFSTPYYVTNQSVLTRVNDKSSALQILTGLGATDLIGATRGSSGARWIRTQLIEQGYDIHRRLYKDYSSAIEALLNGKLDAVIEDVVFARAAVAARPGKLVVAGVIKTHELYSFVVPPSDPNNLLPRINKGMAKLGLTVIDTESGRELVIQPGTPWARLYAVYFGANTRALAPAWAKCGKIIRDAGTFDDVASYTQCMADAVQKSSRSAGKHHETMHSEGA